MWNDIKAWAQSKGGWAHILAVAYLAVMTAYASVPAFKSEVLLVWGLLPHWAVQLLVALGGLFVFYMNPNSPKLKIKK